MTFPKTFSFEKKYFVLMLHSYLLMNTYCTKSLDRIHQIKQTLFKIYTACPNFFWNSIVANRFSSSSFLYLRFHSANLADLDITLYSFFSFLAVHVMYSKYVPLCFFNVRYMWHAQKINRIWDGRDCVLSWCPWILRQFIISILAFDPWIN